MKKIWALLTTVMVMLMGLSVIGLAAGETESETEPPSFNIAVNNGTAYNASWGAITSAHAGDTVIIKANAIGGVSFSYWSVEAGGISVEHKTETAFVMPAANVSVTAHYAAAVSVEATKGGNASANITVAEPGTTITLSQVASEGYEFKGFTITSGNTELSGNSFILPWGNVTVKAEFEAIPYDITTSVRYDSEPNTGKVVEYIKSLTGEDEVIPGTVKVSENPSTIDTRITLTATANDGFAFREWVTKEGGITVSKDNTFTMPACDVAVEALFTAAQYSISVETSPGGKANAAPDLAIYGDTVLLFMQPSSGYEVESYGDADGKLDISDSLTFVMPAKDITINVEFKLTEEEEINSTEEFGLRFTDGTLVTDSFELKELPLQLFVFSNVDKNFTSATFDGKALGSDSVSVSDSIYTEDASSANGGYYRTTVQVRKEYFDQIGNGSHQLVLNFDDGSSLNAIFTTSFKSTQFNWVIPAAIGGAVLIIGVAVAIFLIRKKRRRW